MNFPLDFFSNYQKVRFDDGKDPLKSADIQRKIVIQMYNTSCQSLDNLNTCELLDRNLTKYSNPVFQNGKSIYMDSLQSILAQAQKTYSQSPNQSNIKSINLDSAMKSFLCSKNQKYCTKSEIPGEYEFKEFSNAIRSKVEQPRDQQKATKFTRPTENNTSNTTCFKTARDELQLQNLKKYGNSNTTLQNNYTSNTSQKRKLGTRRNINSKFVSPLLSNNGSNDEIKSEEWPAETDDRLKNIEPKMIELIKSEIMDCGPNIHWDDIAGLKFAKTAIQEAVVWPMLRPDIFTGLRRPPKGILLFGPPGTGKTLIGKCVASQSKSTFFSISASSLTSKWIGDGEKMVRALFTVARVHQPAVIFIDEIDSLLSQRSDTEHESSRRIKTEFLVQLDGATTDNDERILVIGATNRPQELDEAARRRFVKRLYIPLPEYEARLQLTIKLISGEKHGLDTDDFKKIASLSDGYSGADIRNLCSEASLGPIRSMDMGMIEKIQATEVRPLLMEDFDTAFKRVRSSVSPNDLNQYIAWDNTYGSGSGF